jgi:ABC-2 type transport system ATP-binding protein
LLVETTQPVDSLDKVSGVHDIKKSGEELSFQVDSEVLDHVIRYVSGFGIKRLESAPPTLEDLFMRHYDAEGKGTNSGAGGES